MYKIFTLFLLLGLAGCDTVYCNGEAKAEYSRVKACLNNARCTLTPETLEAKTDYEKLCIGK